MIRNRRPYIMGPQMENPPPQLPPPVHERPDEENIKSMLLDSLKTLSASIEEVKELLKALEEKVEYLDSRQRKLENDMDRFAAKSKASELDIMTMRSELDSLRKVNSYPAYNPSFNMDRPIMPGTGFSSVTPNYLKGLQQK